MTTDQKTATLLIATEPMEREADTILDRYTKNEIAQLALICLNEAGLDIDEQFRVLEMLVLET